MPVLWNQAGGAPLGRYLRGAFLRFGAGVLIALVIAWGIQATSALKGPAPWPVEQALAAGVLSGPTPSPMALQSIQLYPPWRNPPLLRLRVAFTGPQAWGYNYCLGEYAGGQWQVAYAPEAVPLPAMSLEPGGAITQSYLVPVDSLMGPGPYRLYTDGLGYIDLPSLQGVLWEKGAAVLP